MAISVKETQWLQFPLGYLTYISVTGYYVVIIYDQNNQQVAFNIKIMHLSTFLLYHYYYVYYVLFMAMELILDTLYIFVKKLPFLLTFPGMFTTEVNQ